ncbi:hypothetical protein CEXT_768331 [Caerostris extrusa]|uniref:Uncharacterized protein n=1 Tax=Caerostris extrusa TaxID=172846 RepID=A0AAV4NQ99_CAEEX|nr:hypothetical protein CEXT_768331 [Caerostris extrusa]
MLFVWVLPVILLMFFLIREHANKVFDLDIRNTPFDHHDHMLCTFPLPLLQKSIGSDFKVTYFKGKKSSFDSKSSFLGVVFFGILFVTFARLFCVTHNIARGLLGPAWRVI